MHIFSIKNKLTSNELVENWISNLNEEVKKYISSKTET